MIAQTDTIPVPRTGSVPLPSDTLAYDLRSTETLPIENMTGDTIPDRSGSYGNEVKIADSDLDQEITYSAQDSQWYDNKEKLMYLYGNAQVNYGDKEIKAELIILDMDNKIAEARVPNAESTSDKATFTDGNQVFQYDGLKYNFETEKGIVYEAVTQEGEFFIHGERTKYVNAKGNHFHNEDVIYNSNSLVTTCTHEHPHFGFRAKKIKVVPDKVVVAGPSNLEIAGVPTPLWIPFGFFPLTEGSSSGLIWPEGYQFYNPDLGFGVQGFGWYFPINDRLDLKLTGRFHTKGTWGLYANSNYKKRYKYNGNLNLSFTQIKTEAITNETFNRSSSTTYGIRWTHNQERKAHPYRSFKGSINIDGNNNNRRLNNTAGAVLTNTYSSSMRFTHNMPSTPFSLIVAMRHDQNTNTRKMNITLPDISLNMVTIFPFEKKNSGSNEKSWYEKISLSYGSKLRAFTTTTDTTLFTQETLDNVRSGMSHEAGLSFTTRFLKYFSFNPRIDYDEVWVLNTIDKRTESVPYYEADSTLAFRDSLYTEVLKKPGTYRDFSTGFSINTQLFATLSKKKGKVRGVRGIISPRIGYSFEPDKTDLVDTLRYFDRGQRIESYSRFEEGPFSNPNFGSLVSSITYGASGQIEMKLFSKKDSTERKVKLLDSYNFSGNYNFAADSLKWRAPTLNTTNILFKGITNITTNWTFDPYVRNNTRRVNVTTKESTGKLLRLDYGRISVTNSLTWKRIKDVFSKKKKKSTTKSDDEKIDVDDVQNTVGSGGFDPDGHIQEDRRQVQNKLEVDRGLTPITDLLNSLRFSHNYNYERSARTGELRTNTVHSLGVSGSIDLTPNWSVSVGNLSYDFVNKSLGYTDVSFSRKLHCWRMFISWQPPSGTRRGTYSFSITADSNALGFLEYNYGRPNSFF